MRASLVLLIGIAAGMGGYYLIEQFVDPGAAGKPGGAAGEGTVPAGGARPAVNADQGRREITRLEAENAKLRRELEAASGGGAGGQIADAGASEEESDSRDGDSMLKFMMSMGREQAKRNVEPELRKIVERLSLSGEQEEDVRIALGEKIDAQMAAGSLMMQGKANLADLLRADEDNFSEFDSAMADILTGDQWGQYEEVQEEREFARIEKKTNKDLEGLGGVVDLTPEQREQAFGIFAELNAAEKPSQAPPDLTFDQFRGFVDLSINNRVSRLEPVLDPDQLAAYQTQVNTYRDMIVNMIGRGTGEVGPEGGR